MKKRFVAVVLPLISAGFLSAQDTGNVFFYQAQDRTVAVGAFQRGPMTPVTGAPYSATITNETTETLEDGSHIVQKTTGGIARDSLGRTRQDAPLPSIGNLAAAKAPHLVFVQDPVAQVSYTLDLTDKTAQKMPLAGQVSVNTMSGSVASGFAVHSEASASAGDGEPVTMALAPGEPNAMAVEKLKTAADDPQDVTTEDLGSQTMEGVTVTGTRTTRVIPTGQIGNDAPIHIVTEVWTSAELKTVVYSKRSDPRIGEQIFQLTNISRNEPDASLFSVPADFQVVDGPRPFIYSTNR